MIGLDTNVLVRYLTQDDPVQSAQVNTVIEQLSTEQPGAISHIVLCELVWVLSRAYQYSREQVAEVIHAVLTCQEFQTERVDMAELAFLDYQQGNADFSDYLLARRHQQMGAEYTVTFDRKAAGAVRMMAMTDFLADA
jgi:predicted nucleic-acid-binding protein